MIGCSCGRDLAEERVLYIAVSDRLASSVPPALAGLVLIVLCNYKEACIFESSLSDLDIN